MPRFVVEPQRDLLKGCEPYEGTHFVKTEDDKAELFAVIDTQEEDIIEDFYTRPEAEALAASLNRGE